VLGLQQFEINAGPAGSLRTGSVDKSGRESLELALSHGAEMMYTPNILPAEQQHVSLSCANKTR